MKLFADSPKGFLIHLLIIILLIIMGVLFFFYAYLPYITNHGETITVPNLIGMHMDKLDKFVKEKDLRYEVSDSSYSDKYPPLTILEQYPKPASLVKAGRKIFISVNRVNAPTVPVPDLTDKSVRNAQAILKSNELKTGKYTYKPSEFDDLVLEMGYEGEIIKAGTLVPKGSRIDIVIGNGKGNSTVTTPELVGTELQEAIFYILGKELEVGTITMDVDTTGQAVFVIEQYPAKDEKVSQGTSVDLTVTVESDPAYQKIKEIDE